MATSTTALGPLEDGGEVGTSCRDSDNLANAADGADVLDDGSLESFDDIGCFLGNASRHNRLIGRPSLWKLRPVPGWISPVQVEMSRGYIALLPWRLNIAAGKGRAANCLAYGLIYITVSLPYNRS